MIASIILAIIGVLAGLLAIWCTIIVICASISEYLSNKRMSHECMEKWGKNGCC